MNYLYGFLSSALVYSLLHWALPDKKFDAFIKDGASAGELYHGRWELTVAEAESVDERVLEQIGKEYKGASV